MINLLADIEALGTRTVVVRGRELMLRALTASESRLLEKHDPRPEPKPGMDERYRRDWLSGPEHRAMTEAYITRRMCSILALSAGLTNRAGEPMEAERPKEWRQRLTDELMGALSEQEIARAYATYLSIYDQDLDRSIGTGEAPGNSSAPSPTAGAGVPGDLGGSCPSGTGSPGCTGSSGPPSGSGATPGPPSSDGTPTSRSR